MENIQKRWPLDKGIQKFYLSERRQVSVEINGREEMKNIIMTNECTDKE